MDKKDLTLQAKVEGLEKSEILEALRQSGWVKSGAARALGITKRMVAYKIKKYGLEKEVDEQKGRIKADRYKVTDTQN